MNKNNENNLNKPRSNALADYYHPQKKGAIDWPSFEQMRKEIIGDVPETELKELWSVNYKQHILPLLTPANRSFLVWTEDEDLLILHFYFDQSARKEEMRELLGRKSIDYLIERYRFMNLPVSTTLQETLGTLRTASHN